MNRRFNRVSTVNAGGAALAARQGHTAVMRRQIEKMLTFAELDAPKPVNRGRLVFVYASARRFLYNLNQAV